MRRSNEWVWLIGIAAAVYFVSRQSAPMAQQQTAWQPAGGINPVIAKLALQFLPPCPYGETLGTGPQGEPACIGPQSIYA